MTKELDCLARRAQLNAPNAGPDKLSQIGRDLSEADFIADAVDFYAKADDREALRRLFPLVIKDGDYFLFTRLEKVLQEPAAAADLKALADNAAKLGKNSFAAQAESRLLEDRPLNDTEEKNV